MINSAFAQGIVYVQDQFQWNWSTLIMCLCGQLVHWLSSYGRAHSVCMQAGKPGPSLIQHWLSRWPSSLAALITVICGYFMIPEIGAYWPEAGRALGVLNANGETVGLSMISAFLWGAFGALVAEAVGRRVQAMVAQ